MASRHSVTAKKKGRGRSPSPSEGIVNLSDICGKTRDPRDGKPQYSGVFFLGLALTGQESAQVDSTPRRARGQISASRAPPESMRLREDRRWISIEARASPGIAHSSASRAKAECCEGQGGVVQCVPGQQDTTHGVEVGNSSDPVTLALNGISGQMRRAMVRDVLTAEGERRFCCQTWRIWLKSLLGSPS